MSQAGELTLSPPPLGTLATADVGSRLALHSCLGDWAECCGKMTGRHLVTSALASTEFASLVHALAVHVTCLHSTLFEISFAICFAVRASLATLMHALANPRQHASRLVTHWPSTTLLCTATTRCTCFAVCFNLFTCDHWCCTV
jgi:hypothetical protein